MQGAPHLHPTGPLGRQPWLHHLPLGRRKGGLWNLGKVESPGQRTQGTPESHPGPVTVSQGAVSEHPVAACSQPPFHDKGLLPHLECCSLWLWPNLVSASSKFREPLPPTVRLAEGSAWG